MLVQRYGRIVNVVSLSGIKGMPGQTNYSAAKGGLIAATKALAQEVAKKQVTVNAVAPGFIRTEMTADLDESALRKTIPVGRFGEPEEVADLVAFLVSKQAGYITGEVISINGGIFYWECRLIFDERRLLSQTHQKCRLSDVADAQTSSICTKVIEGRPIETELV